MRKVQILVNNIAAGVLEEQAMGHYQFSYAEQYVGPPVSLTMPIKQKIYHFEHFPPFFEGLLPEGNLLEALLRKHKLDKADYFGQLIIVGQDVVGNVTILELR